MAESDRCTGYPVGNFGIGGEITPGGRIFSRVLYNPPVLGQWLEVLGRGGFSFTCDGVRLADTEFEKKVVYRLFPEASATYSDSRLGQIKIQSTFLAPIKAPQAFNCTIPALCAEFEITNSSRTDKEITTEFDFYTQYDRGDMSLVNSGGFWLAGSSLVKIGYNGPISWHGIDDGLSVSIRKTVPAGSAVTLRFLLLCHDFRGHYAQQYPDWDSLTAFVSDNWEQFATDRTEFISMLPRTHDEKINEYLRWYLQAGILLTRMTRDRAITMGYCELNQRDSFWTSWLHLVMWPELDRLMIEESANSQRSSGKIPTTILTTIDRGDDIDINEYFNLRVTRYYEWTRDLEIVRRLWPSLKLSIGYLNATDKDNDGYLDQSSYWCDWKDVYGVEGRKAAPHFEFLWLAVLKSAVDYAKKFDDFTALLEYTELYKRSYSIIHKHVNEGGLWSGKFYTSRWYDGRQDQHVQEDQTVGPLFGVVPEERISSIYESLEPNMADWGVRDTYPYRDNFSHAGGDYHNGGIWPFLNFADALSRFQTGYLEGGYQILRRVGEYDLEREGDYLPSEFLQGDTGANAGWYLQGWDADYYAAVFFGVLGVKMLSESHVQIMPRIADTETFETAIVLPQGLVHVKQTPTRNGLQINIGSQLHRKITIRYGAMTAKTTESGTSEKIGECAFYVATFTLAPKATHKIVFK